MRDSRVKWIWTLLFAACSSAIPITISGYGLAVTVVIPARDVPTKVVIPAQTIVVPASANPVVVALPKPPVVVPVTNL